MINSPHPDEQRYGEINSGTVQRLGSELLPYKKAIVITVVAMILTATADLLLPFLFGLAIDVVRQDENRTFIGMTGSTALNWLAVAFVVVIALRFVAYNRQIFYTAWLGQRLVWDLRDKMFRHLQRLGIRYVDTRGVGRIMSRLQNDVYVIEMAVTEGLIGLATAVIVVFGILGFMFIMNFQLALLALAVMPLLVIFMYFWRRHAAEAFRQVQMRIARVNGNLAESISGVRVIQAFAHEPRSTKQFDDVNNHHLDASIDAAKLTGMVFPAVLFIEGLATALVLFFGGRLVLGSDAFTVGELFTFAAYINRFYEPVRDIAMRYNMFQRAMAGSDRIYELLDVEEEVVDAPDAIELPRIVGHVEFDNVRFGYEGEEVLHGVSLDVQPGESIAFIGETGAGKSSMINLMARFYDVWDGAIRIDGYDIRDVTQKSLRRQLGIVLQDTYLFAGTVSDNIKYGKPDATDEEMMHAARAVGAHEFIMKMPEGYHSEVHERGSVLSVGQRQLISFARALLADPRIIILDEATSSVDTETEIIIQDALRELLKGRTAFMIAHRLSTVKEASKVVVMDQGQIIEMGSHDELIAQRGAYYNYYTMQFSQQVETPAAD